MTLEPPPLSLALSAIDVASIGLATGATSPAPREVSSGGALVRSLLQWTRDLGFTGVQLDITFPGIRPRDLDRSARRDLASLLRRHELACSGLDLFIPPEHFTSPALADRAVSSVLSALELAGELAALSRGAVASRSSVSAGARFLSAMNVSLTLPATIASDVWMILAARAESCGVRLADHQWPVPAHLSPNDWIGVGLDPASVLQAGGAGLTTASGDEPGRIVSVLGQRLACARLSDVSRVHTSVRCAPGASAGGRLDLLSYSIALTTAGYAGRCVLDLRGVPDQTRAASAALNAWSPVLA